jgi:hypothetical protein
MKKSWDHESSHVCQAKLISSAQNELPGPESFDSAAAPGAGCLRVQYVLEGRPINYDPLKLKLHRALDQLGWTSMGELNDAARLEAEDLLEPIIVTTEGIVLSGIGAWQLALLECIKEVPCIEYQITENESLQFILAQHRTRRQWNAFVLIRLALTLEPHFQEKALNNMRAGGEHKGSTNLPEADRIDVRQEIAKVAGTGTGNVSKVKAILRSANPNIIAALQNGQLSIHRAWGWRNLPKAAQKEEFARCEEERIQSKVLRGVVESRGKPPFNATETIAALRMLESHNPGCIVIRAGTRMSTVVTLGKDAIELFRNSERTQCQ